MPQATRTPRVRTRSLGSQEIEDRFRQYYTLGGLPAGTRTYSVGPESYGEEYCRDELHRGPPFKTGGPLSLQRIERDRTVHPYSDVGDGFHSDSGECYVDWDPGYSYLAQAGSTFPAFEYGAEGWAKCRPGRPVLSLAVSIAELKEAPKLILKRLDSIKSIANNHLAVQFGWKPLLNDIKGLINAQATIDKRLKQLKRDNGRGVRRRCTLLAEESTDSGSVTGNLARAKIKGVDSLNDVPLPVTMYRTDSTTESVWFVARWRYWIPDIDTPEFRKRAIRKTFGLELTPALAWELLPWSWLIDWFSNVGDVISNLDYSILPDLAADYAFVMHERRKTRQVTCSFELNQRFQAEHTAVDASADYELVEKYREYASPYGFDVSWPDFSPAQLGILLALGITKS